MESERPAHAEYQHSGARSVKLKNHQVSFTTSSFRLQNASKLQYTALLESQPLNLDRAGTTGAGPSQRVGAGSFSLLDDSSSGRMPSTARQPGLMMSSAAERKTGSRHEIGITYVTSGGPKDKGVVPLITVGSVFTLFNRRELFTHPGQSALDVLLQAMEHKKAPSIRWLLKDMQLGTQVAMQGGKVANWVTAESAEEAARSREWFQLPDRPSDRKTGSGGKQPMRSKEIVWTEKEEPSSATVRKAFPRPPSFLLPKHLWLPGAKKPPTEPSGMTGAPWADDPAAVKIKTQLKIMAAPLVHFINALKDEPIVCGFQLEADQEKIAMDTHAAWQRAQQALRVKIPEQAGATAAEPIDSTSSGMMQRSLSLESDSSFRRGGMPVFRLPGVQIRLPTAVGVVSFSPLFLSKEQLTRTWGAIRAVHRRWLMRQRRSERRQLRLNIEQLAAGLAGVRIAPPALPPASASASAARPGEEEDEEGMDEPPEVKAFLQELGEGGRAAQEPGLPNDGLPASGVGLALVSCATGTLSLGMRCIEQVCNQADRLFSLTPVGKQALGFLPDPLISVHSLGALAERTNAQNVRVLYDLAQEGAFGPGIDVTPASDPEEASSEDSTIAHPAGSEEGPAGLPKGDVRDDATPRAQDRLLEQGPDQGNERGSSTAGDATSAHSSSSSDAVRHGQGVTELHAGDPSSSVEQESIIPHRHSRLGTFLGRLRRRKQPDPAPVQASQSMQSDSLEAGPQSSDQSTPDTQQQTPERSAEQSEAAAAGPKVPGQLDESSAPEARDGEHSSSEIFQTAQHAASSVASESQASETRSSSMRAAEEAQGEHTLTVSTGDGTELPDVRLDWAVMNESMMHSLHSFVTTLTTALIAQSLGMQVMGVPGLKRPRGKSRGSAGNQQEQRSSSAGADSDAPDAVSDHDLDRAIVPFQESQPMQQEDAAAAGAEQYAGDMEIIFNADKVAGLELDQDEEKNTLKGLLLVGHLDVDPKGEEMPWPVPAIGLGNGAHLAWAELRCTSDVSQG